MQQGDIQKALEDIHQLQQSDRKQALEANRVLLERVSSADVDFSSYLSVAISYGNLLVMTADYIEALAVYKKARANIPKPENPTFLCDVLNGIAIVLSHMGRLADSAKTYDEAIRFAEEAGDTSYKAKFLINIGNLLSKQSEHRQATDRYKEALELLADGDDYHTRIIVNANLGGSLNNLDLTEDALSHLNAAQTLAEKHEQSFYLPYLLIEKGKVFKQLGLTEIALKNFTTAIERADSLNDQMHQIEALLNRHAMLAEQNKPQAANDLELATTIANDIENVAKQRDCNKVAWQYFKAQKKFELALDAHEQYAEFERTLEDQAARNQLVEMQLNELQQAQARIEVISNIGRQITAELDLENVLNLVYKELNKLLDATIFGIGRFEESTNEVHYELFIEADVRQPLAVRNLTSAKTLAAWVIKNRKSVTIQDANVELDQYDVPNAMVNTGVSNALSILFVPLIVMDQVVGIMTTQSYQLNAYSIADIETFQALASYVAIAMKNAQQARLIQEQNEELNRQAKTDGLTGVSNRRYLEEAFDINLSWARRVRQPISLLLIDLDHFKKLNDTHGHLAGDVCLKSVATLLKQSFQRKHDVVARYGGEEFAVLLGGVDSANVLEKAEHLRKQLEQLDIHHEELVLNVTASIGCHTLEGGELESTFAESIELADIALYDAKTAGRNRVIQYLV